MGNIAVLYQSIYGSTRLYAQHIARSLDADLFDLGGTKMNIDFDKYETLIFGGGLYANKVSGIKFLASNADKAAGKNLVIFTVGIGDPALAENARMILKGVGKNLPKELMQRAHLYSFRGGLDWANLKFVHRTMMKMMRNMLLKKKEEERTDDDRAIIDSFGGKLDFTDVESAMPLIEYVWSLK